jgi:adenylate cyclase
LQAAFAEEEYQGLLLATRLRLIAIAVIAVWIWFENPFPEVLFYYAMIAGFAILGVVPLWLRRAGLYAPWQRYLFPLLDIVLMTLTVMAPNPLSDLPALPPQTRLRLENDLYFYLFLIIAVLTYSPRVVLWTGVSAAAAWSAATLWVLSLPETVTLVRREDWSQLTYEQVLTVILDPRFVDLGRWGRQIVLLLVVSGGLAVIVRRSRRLVLRQADAERQRANLSRYFSPNMVDDLAASDEPLGATRTQRVGVMFVDLVGFTALSAQQSAEAVIELLREFHRLVASTVFAHGGTLDKFLGDGALVTFGTPRSGERDAANALRCARAIVRAVGEWSGQRERQGQPPVRIGVGLHYGPVVLGDVGDAQRMEFAVVGDTVNVASRLQELTRTLGATLLVSQDLLDAARSESAFALSDVEGLREIAPQAVRGRTGTLHLWALDAPAPNRR